MKHTYLAITFKGGKGFQEVNRLGVPVRLTDATGHTITPVEYRITDDAPPQPDWATDDDTPERVPRAFTADDVRTETLRRLCLAFGARDQQHLSIKVQDAMMQAGVLTDRLARGVGLTPQEQEKAQWLRRQQALYAHVKAVGNAFEAQALAGTLGEDFRADQHWMAEEAAT